MTRMSVPIVLACVCLAIAPASTGAHSDSPKCRDVDADFTSQLAPAGCASPLGLCASGNIRHDAWLKGPMYITIADGAPSAGMAASEPPSLLSVSGTRFLKPRRGGSLTAHAIGILDTGTFEFTELNVITSGTGPFAGATGTLYVNGRAVGPDTFAGRITGVVCLP